MMKAVRDQPTVLPADLYYYLQTFRGYPCHDESSFAINRLLDTLISRLSEGSIKGLHRHRVRYSHYGPLTLHRVLTALFSCSYGSLLVFLKGSLLVFLRSLEAV